MPVPCCVITGGASNHSSPVPSPPLDVTRQKKTAATEFPLDMTAFKVRLRVPSAQNAQASSAPKEASPSSSASQPDAEAAAESPADVSLQGEAASEDELADDSMAAEGSPDTSLNSAEASKSKKAKSHRRLPPAPGSISAVAATLSLEELDALPSAKRRKGLKTRGAPGPGRGWRKGLSKGQKPVYRLPGSGMSTADLPQNLAVQATTPPTIGKMAAAMTSETSSAQKRKHSSSTKTDSPAPSTSTIKVAQNAPDAVFKYPSIPSSKDTPDILPLARIPNYIPTIQPLARSFASNKPRPWRQATREILSIGGRPWRAPVWLSEASDEPAAPQEAPASEESTPAPATASSPA